MIIIPSDEEIIKYIGHQESQEFRTMDEYKDELLEYLDNGDQLVGDTLPWSKTHFDIRLRDGEISIWAGMNGHMKSMMTGMVALWLAHSTKVCIASMEMKPRDTILRMAHQSAGCKPSKAWVERLVHWGMDRIYIYDQLDTVMPDRILGMVYYAAKELGCKHIFIDSLTKCGIPSKESGLEKSFIDRLAWAAKTLRVHVHLIAHVRKPSQAGEEYIPNKFDVRGAGELVDLVDNLFIVWKNKQRSELQRLQNEGFALNDKQQEKLEKESDQLLIVAKQRHGVYEGKTKLWFHGDSMQFTPDGSNRPLPFNLG
jgi:twinkle protein